MKTMSNGEGGDIQKPVDLQAIRGERQEEVVHTELVAGQHRAIAREEAVLREVLRPKYLNTFAQKYAFKNANLIFALGRVIRSSRTAELTHISIKPDHPGDSELEMCAAEIAVELDSAPDEQSRGEALKILEHFFGHPA